MHEVSFFYYKNHRKCCKSTSFKVNQQWNSARNDNFFLLAQLGPNAFWHPLSAESRVRHGD